MEQGVTACRKNLLIRLSSILFFSELAHGMLLYGIIPALVKARFAENGPLLWLSATAIQVAGFSVAGYTLSELAFKLPAGRKVDRDGPDRPLRFGLALSLLSVPIILFSPNRNVVMLGCILHGMGACSVWPAVISAWTQGRSARERGEIMGQILTGWMAGLGLGVILGNILVGLTGKVETVVTCAPILMWTITLVAAFWRGERLGYSATHGMNAQEQEAHLSFRFPPELAVMAIGLFLQNLAFGSLVLPFRELATDPDLFQMNPAQFALMILLGGGPSVLLLGPMGRVSDRIGRRNAVIRSMMLVAPMIAVAPFLVYLPGGPWARFFIMVPGILLAAVAYATLLPAWHALALSRIAEAHRGTSLALLMSVEMLALGLGQVTGTSLFSIPKIGFTVPFLFAGGTFGVLALLYQLGYILPQETHDEHHGEGPGPDQPAPIASPTSPHGSNGAGPTPPTREPEARLGSAHTSE